MSASPSSSPGKGRRAGAQEQAGGASREEREFHESIVRRTNELFVKLNITTRPIQAFEELQKSASSMFVAIFETLFNVRLKNVIRKPRVVTDYIANAQLVMTALSESLPIDLSFLSGEAIYHGDPMQIHHMLSIFESLWAQLGHAQSVSIGTEGSGEESSFLDEELAAALPDFPQDDSPRKHQYQYQRAATPFPGASMGPGSVPSSPYASSREGRGDRPSSSGGGLKQSPKTQRRLSGSQSPGGSGARTPRSAAELRRVGKRASKRTDAGQGVTRRANPAKRKSGKRKAQKKLRKAQDENARRLQQQIRARKVKTTDLPDTKGSAAMRKAAQRVKAAARSSESAKGLRKQTEIDSLETLAAQYPTLYRTLARKRGSLASNSSKASQRQVLAQQLESDMQRYQKAYALLIKGYEAEMRKTSYNNKRRAVLAAKSRGLDHRIERARTARMQQDLQSLEKSWMLRRQAEEELMVRHMFDDAMLVEKEVLLAMKRKDDEERAKIEEERANRFASIEQYYKDREEMLQEKLAQQGREKAINDQARKIAVKQLETKLRTDYAAKFEKLTQDWRQHEEHDFLRHREHLTSSFAAAVK
ncbi:Centrosomal protein of 95 kDa (Cep95) (Coiled-coil domain-containing protein 45) [Durusdinium trenchii]|uniref:Centrosomal protein of 95 kDa (Cep95) (Coiled-coil domain-containing protein 45) n=1 Tax=Durusdinium trenchii TaxID=1381693 RepID=A0ABP0JPB8_9DINO